MGTLKLDRELRIAFVGVAKNCGKTTTMNAVASRLRARGHRLGLLSIGVDGEVSDALLETPKPPVAVREGELVATASSCLSATHGAFEFVEDLGFRTPLGESVIARCTVETQVVLAGLRHRQDVAKAATLLESHGANRIFIDGAYGRLSGAHACLTRGLIVSTGAIVSHDVDTLVEETAELIQRFEIPHVDKPWERSLGEEAGRRERALLGCKDGTSRALPSESALIGLREARDLWSEDVRAIAIPGLVSDGVVRELLRVKVERPLTLIASDPTAIQAKFADLKKLARSWEVRTLDGARVVGVSVNPTSIRGPGVSFTEVEARLKALWPDVPIFDGQLGID